MPKFSKFSFIIFVSFLVILFSFSLSFFNNFLFKNKVIYAQESNNSLQVGRYQLSIATAGQEGAGWVCIGIIDTITGKIWTRMISGYNVKEIQKFRNGDNYYLWEEIKFTK